MYYLNANIQMLVFTYTSLYPLNRCSIIVKDKKTDRKEAVCPSRPA